MASASLKKELECSICLFMYTDPVMLRCGHNYCRICIDHALDKQRWSGRYSCPECRTQYMKRPELQRNLKLRNIVENFPTSQPDQEWSGVSCTYCIYTPVPAVKFCVMCEASLCDNHLTVHSKSPEHVLCDPTTSVQNRKCSIHKRILEYYCKEDSTCVCGSCCFIGGHKGHQMVSLDEASERKKSKLSQVLQKCATKGEEIEKRAQSLEESKKTEQGKSAGEAESVTTLFTDFRRKLDNLEKAALSDISRQADLVSLSFDDMIQQLKIKKEELFRKMGDIEELCNMTDPLVVLQGPDAVDLWDTKDGEDRKECDKPLHDGGDLDVVHFLQTGLSDIITSVGVVFCIKEAADILLDGNTANTRLHISDDGKSVTSSSHQKYPENSQRFQYPQVISSQSFSLGQHYWEVDVRASERWRVGMCYPSIARKGDQSWIGENNKSWCLCKHINKYLVIHNRKVIQLANNLCSNGVRISLDYEAGQISFYDLCLPIRPLHTFTATFTEPLHAALRVWDGRLKLRGGNREKLFKCEKSSPGSP